MKVKKTIKAFVAVLLIACSLMSFAACKKEEEKSRDKLANQYESASYYFRQGYSDSWKINMQPTDGKLVPDYADQNLALQLIPAAEATGVQYNIFCNWNMEITSMTDSSTDIATKIMDENSKIYFNKINYLDPRDEYVQADTASPVTYNKMQWNQVTFTYIDQDGDQCKGVWNLLTEGTDFYIVSYEAKADKYDTYFTQFEEMINDFKKIGFEKE